MPAHRRDPRLARRHFISFAVLGVSFLALFAVVLSAPDYKWPAALAAALIAIAGLVTQELQLRRFRCPACRSRLAYPELPPGTRLEFHCPRCDILWDAGVSATSDYSG